MAFGKQDPAEILGMTQDELKQKLDRIESLEAKLTEFGDASKKSSEGVASILQTLEAMKPKKDEDDLDYLADPEKVIEKNLQPLADQTLNNTILIQHRNARDNYPVDFSKWGTEIVKRMAELPAQQQADPRIWRSMVMIIRGEHAEDLEKSGAKGDFSFLEPVAAGLRPDPKSADNLSSGERHMVKKLSPFGITAEKYQKGKKRLEEARTARLGSFAGLEA